MNTTLQAVLNYLVSPFTLKAQRDEWIAIAASRLELLQGSESKVAYLENQLSYYTAIVNEHDNILALNVREMKTAQSLAKQWRTEADSAAAERDQARDDLAHVREIGEVLP